MLLTGRQIEVLLGKLIDIRNEAISPNESAATEKLDDVIRWFKLAIEREGRPAKLVHDADHEIQRKPREDRFDFASRPNFLIGNRRSGTTLVMYLLNATRSIFALPENMLGGEFAGNDKLFKSGYLNMPSMNRHQEEFAILIGETLDGLYSRFAAEHGKERWISKELFSASRLDRIDAMFNYKARFIYMVRHGFNVAYSCSARFPPRGGPSADGKTSLNLEAHLNEWITNNELTMDFYERNSDRCLLIRYEELTISPRDVSRRIVDFLGESWSDDLLDLAATQHSRPMMGDQKILVRGKGVVAGNEWWSDWPDGLKRVLARRANGTLVRLGYEPVQI